MNSPPHPLVARIVLPLQATTPLAVANISARHSWHDAAESERLFAEVFKAKNLGGQALNKLKALLGRGSNVDFNLASRDVLRERGWRRFAARVAPAVVGLAAAEISALRKRASLLRCVVVASAALGVMAPALSMTAQQATPLGDMDVFRESRGIWATISQLLGRDGSLVVGAPRLLFSIVMPQVKLPILRRRRP